MKTLILMATLAGALWAEDFIMPKSLDRLAAKAKESVDVTLDGNMLQLAGKFLSRKSPDEAKVKKLIQGLKGIYVKSFEFDQPGQYTDADIESVRSQLKGPLWSRIVGVQSKKEGENAEVFFKTENNQIVGLAVIAAEPRELTVVSIVGPIDPEELSTLGGQFGIPQMEVHHGGKK